MECHTKRIWGKGVTSYISWFFILLPYAVSIFLVIMDRPKMLWDLPFAILLSYFFYITIGIGGLGYVSIGENIRTNRDLTPSFRYIQGKLDIKTKDIVGIEFTRLDGNSDGLRKRQSGPKSQE